MSNAVTVPVSEAPRTSVTTLLRTTKDAVQDGIADARASVEEAWPKVVETMNRGIYHMAYGIAFGVTFPIVLVAKSVPQNNCIVWGLVDGAKAARCAANRVSKAAVTESCPS